MNKKKFMIIAMLIILGTIAFISYKNWQKPVVNEIDINEQDVEIFKPSTDNVKTNSELNEQSQLEQTKESKKELNYKDLERINSEGAVELVVTFLNPINDDDEKWIFNVEMNTHSVNLDQYDLEKLITFKNDTGTVITDELTVKKDGAGHHMGIKIYIPKIINEKPTIDENTNEITIEISEIDNVVSRLFVWDLTQLVGEFNE